MQDHREVQSWFTQRHRLVEFQEASSVGGNQAELELDRLPVGPMMHTLGGQMPGHGGHPSCGARCLLHRVQVVLFILRSKSFVPCGWCWAGSGTCVHSETQCPRDSLLELTEGPNAASQRQSPGARHSPKPVFYTVWSNLEQSIAWSSGAV